MLYGWIADRVEAYRMFFALAPLTVTWLILQTGSRVMPASCLVSAVALSVAIAGGTIARLRRHDSLSRSLAAIQRWPVCSRAQPGPAVALRADMGAMSICEDDTQDASAGAGE